MPFALLGTVAVVGAIALVPGLEDDEVPTLLIGCGLVGGTGAFLSGGLLRQRQVAESTALSVSADGILTVRDPSGEITHSLVGARDLSVQQAASVERLYGADIPVSLRSSGARGAVLVGSREGIEIIRFTGQLPIEGQRRLLESARPFLAAGAAASRALPTPDERYAASSVTDRAAGFGRLILMVLVMLIPTGGFIAAQVAFAGHLDPNTRWLAILLWIASGVVIAVGLVRLMRSRSRR